MKYAWITCLLLVGAVRGAVACALWCAAGSDAAGGVVVSKNRDAIPDHKQVLKIHRPSGGYAYFGLYAVGGQSPGLKDGVNEKGLTVLTASASCLTKGTRDDQPGKRPILASLLSHYATCDEVLAAQKPLFEGSRAIFLMIADRKKVLEVEAGLRGRYAIRTVEDGHAAHTNHYLDKSLAEFNVVKSASSAARLRRIDALLTRAGPRNTEAFSQMAADQHDGPNRSLWRTGKERTLASWIVESPAQGPQKLRVVLANPREAKTTNAFVLDEEFWQ